MWQLSNLLLYSNYTYIYLPCLLSNYWYWWHCCYSIDAFHTVMVEFYFWLVEGGGDPVIGRIIENKQSVTTLLLMLMRMKIDLPTQSTPAATVYALSIPGHSRQYSRGLALTIDLWNPLDHLHCHIYISMQAPLDLHIYYHMHAKHIYLYHAGNRKRLVDICI